MNSASIAVSDSQAPFYPASSLDYVPIKQLRALQSHRLRHVVSHVYENVSLYRQRMHKGGVTPVDIRGVEDIERLPFTTKADLRDTYPSGMFAVPSAQIASLHTSSGATGEPIVVAYTRRDMEVWTEVIVRCLVACEFHQRDIVQNACGHHLFADGLGLQAGVEALGATVIPVSGGDADHQVMVMRDFNVSAVCSTPSYFLYLVERAEKLGIDLCKLPLRVGAFVGGPWSESIRRRIEASAGIKAYFIFGLAELIGPGVGTEGCHQNGLHIFEDHFYPEIVDPETGAILPPDKEGELVLTTLSKEAMPLIRYRTEELAAIRAEPCPCGRTLRQIRRVGRRGEDMCVIQGVSVYPSQIEAALLAVEGNLPHYQIVLTQDKGLDQVEVQIEITPEIFSDRVSAMETLEMQLARKIGDALSIPVAVRLVEPRSIERSGDRARRVIDRRGI
ncbi:MAG TPA: phenylacetate--CoA ligase [Verrucomicrobiae bacterium]|nr:phenylacetate--CoA ligase [Verrucomicrobiae bacterium]